MPLPPEEQVKANAELFGRVAHRYDHLGFLTLAALALAQHTVVGPADRVLEVACGTGTVALALADRAGEVVGTDLAPAMVQAAERKAQASATRNITFLTAEATALPFPDHHFDGVVCGAGLFFVPDMVQALREWRRVLRPGGQVVYSAFGRGLLGPLPALWRERLASVGEKPGAPPLGRITTPEAATALLREAGFEQAEAQLKLLDYTLPDPLTRWQEIEAGLEGALLTDCPPAQRERLKQEHLSELAPLFAAGPLTVPLPVILARGQVPGQSRAL